MKIPRSLYMLPVSGRVRGDKVESRVAARRLLGTSCLACSPIERCRGCASKTYDTPKSGITVEATYPQSALVVCQPSPQFGAKLLAQGYSFQSIVNETSQSFECGTVYRAHARWCAKPLAIRVLKAQLLQSRFARKIFSQEASAIKELDHPNIAALYDYGIDDNGAPYLVTDYIEGESLQALIQQCALQDPLPLLIQVCEALVYAHSENILHGRLKPSKIIAVRAGNGAYLAKLFDFSVTAALVAHLPFDLANLHQYASPEERAGCDLDHRADVFSLGCIMYETVTGCQPIFKTSRRLPSFPRLRGRTPLLEPVIMRCLQDDPGERYEGAAQLLSELRRVAET